MGNIGTDNEADLDSWPGNLFSPVLSDLPATALMATATGDQGVRTPIPEPSPYNRSTLDAHERSRQQGKSLRQQLQEFGIQFSNQPYGPFEVKLLELLYNDLVAALDQDPFFPDNRPTFDISLGPQQKSSFATEYDESARGRPCGHVFAKGETVYRCRNCGIDDTCVLCQRCFKASNHAGHDVAMSINSGAGGCCDCGDAEAWRVEAHCAYHYSESPPETVLQPSVPVPVEYNIRSTVSSILDFMLDVMSHAKDSAKPPRLEDDTNPQVDASRSRLVGSCYDDNLDAAMERKFSAVLWNDEKHTFDEVIDIVKRACNKDKAYGRQVAALVNDRGRATVYTGDLKEAVRIATFLSRIRLGVTVRCARDVCREDMVEILVSFLHDIAGLSVVLPDHSENTEIVRQVICEEICQPWRQGVSSFGSTENDEKPTEPMADSEDEDGDEEEDEQTAEEREGEQENTEMLDIQEGFTTTMREPELHPDIAAHLAQLTNQQRQVLLATHNQNRLEAGLPPQTALPLPNDAGQVTILDQNGDEARNGLQAILELEGQMRAFEVPMNIFGTITNTGTLGDNTETDDVFPESLPPSLSIDANRRQVNPEHWKAESHRFEGLGKTRLTSLFLQDLRLWKVARAKLRELYITTMVAIPMFKREMGIRFAIAYKELTEAFLCADREPDQSMILFSVQIFTVPSIAEILVRDYKFITKLLAVCYTYYSQHKIGYPEEVDTNAKQLTDVYATRSQRHYHIVNDLRYLLCTRAVQKLIPSMLNVQAQFIDWLELFQGQNPQQKALRHHVEYESDSWTFAFNVTMQIAKHAQMFARTFEHARRTYDHDDELLRIITICVYHLGKWHQGEHRNCRPAFEPRVPSHEFISFHHPLHWLLVGLTTHLTANDNLSFLYASGKNSDDVMKLAQYPAQVLHMTWEIRANLWVRNGHSIREQLYYYSAVDSREYCLDKDLQFMQITLASVGTNKRFSSTVPLTTPEYLDQFQMHNQILSAMFKIFKSVPAADWMGDEMNLVHMQEYLFHFFINVFSERSWLLKTSNEDNIARAIRHGLIFGPMTYSEISKLVNDDRGDEACFDQVVERMTEFTPPAGLEDVGKFTLKESELDRIDPYYYHYTLQQIEEANEILKKRPITEKVVLECILEPIDSAPWNGMIDFACCDVIQDYIIRYFTCLRRSTVLNPKIATNREGVTDKILQFLLLILQEEQGRRKRAAGVLNWNVFPLKSAEIFLQPGLSDDPVFIPHRAKLTLLIARLTELNGTSGETGDSTKNSSKRELNTDERETPEMEFSRKKASAKARQAKLLDEMRASQNAFIKKNKVEDFDYSDIEDTELDQESEVSTWHYPTGNCIICQTALSATGATYGVLSCIQDSRLDRPTHKTFQCQKAVQDLMDHPLVMDEYYEWHAKCDKGNNYEPPLSRDTITTCGHAMHWTCYEEFFDAIKTNHRDMVNQGRNLPSDIEYQCPLCKTVGNTMLPVLSKTMDEQAAALHAKGQSYDDFLLRMNSSKKDWQINYYHAAENLVENMVLNREFVETAESLRSAARPLASGEFNVSPNQLKPWPMHRGCFGDLEAALEVHSNVGRRSTNYSSTEQPAPDWITNVAILTASIVDVEIALRDRTHNDNSRTPITTLIDGLSDQNLVSLRVQADMIRGGIALMYYDLAGAATFHWCARYDGVTDWLRSGFERIFHNKQGGSVPIFADDHEMPIPLLQQDIFNTFVEASIFCARSEDINNFANLFLEIELVKACTVYLTKIAIINYDQYSKMKLETVTDADAEIIAIVRDWILGLRLPDLPALVDATYLTLYRILQRYALAFVRKYCVFAYAVFGMKLSNNVEIQDENELDKLSRLFGIRPVAEILQFSNTTADQYRRRLHGEWAGPSWLTEGINATLSWPLPVSLVKLPQSLDELFEQCLYTTCRKCQTTPALPAMCLLCGDFVCFQSQCCWNEEIGAGECTTHRADCGGSVGIYLLIKRSALLVMRREGGAFGPSPYLDIHGEQDPELKRGKPQFLNERRYEAGIRQMYLQHQIPSWLARKAELYANMGGWETL